MTRVARTLIGLLAAWTTAGCAPPEDARLDADAPLDAGGADASGVDAQLADAQPPPTCVDDPFGFGTAELPATTLDPGRTPGLVVCPPDVDWFAIDLPVGRPFSIRVQADRAVRLRVGDAISAADRRAALRGVVPPGGVIVGVEAADAAAIVRYALTAAIAVSDCADVAEPDDTPAQARLLDGSAEGVVCDGDQDVHVVAGPPGARVRVQVALTEGQGISVAALADFDGQGVPVEIAEASITRRVGADGRALFAVRPVGAGGRYRASATVEPLDAAPIQRVGRVRIPDRVVRAEGLAPATLAPMAGLIVDALVDGELAAVGRTDAEGEWILDFAAPAEAEVTVRARASVWDAPRLIVVGPTVDQPWADVIGELADLPDTSAIGRAAHVAGTLAVGMRALAPFLPILRRPPVIHARWTPGGAAPCGTCYQPATDVIELSGRLTDPDEWDDAIILHELVHHVAARYGRDDSPGGAHDGSPVAPALAWSEGFATAAAAWIMANPLAFDSRATGVRVVDLERMDDPRAFGTANDRPDGPISEYLVAALLWDLLDDPADDDDAEDVTPDAVFEAAFSGLALRVFDAGAPGVDLLDHAEEIACRAPVGWPALLAARDLDVDVVCRNKPASMLSPIDGGLRVGCSGWLAMGEDRRWVAAGARLRGHRALRLDCGAIVEHFDPGERDPEPEQRWLIRGGAAQAMP